MTQNLKHPAVILIGGVVLALLAFKVSQFIFGGSSGPGTSGEFVERTDDNNVVCFDCRHRFRLTWEQLGRQAAAGRSAAGEDRGTASPGEPPTCPSCRKAHLNYQVIRCPDAGGILYIGMTADAPSQLSTEQLEAYCKTADE